MDIAVELLDSNFQLGDRAAALNANCLLMGAFPELNSLRIVGIVSGIEETTGSEVADTEISEDIFQTVDTLALLNDRKQA